MSTSEPLQYSRINANDLKMQIVRNLGSERSKRYFGFLNKLLAQKLSKSDFNKFCIPILGRENISLHNQLIHSILANALQAKTPPLNSLDKAVSKAVGKKASHGASVVNHEEAPSSSNSVWTNGHTSPTWNHKVRMCNHDQRTKDVPSNSHTQNGRTEVAFHSSVSSQKNAVKENGFLGPSRLARPMLQQQQQQHQDVSSEPPLKRPRAECIAPNSQPVPEINGSVDNVAVENSELRQAGDFNSKRGPLQAPLGIPLCSASVGGAQRSLTLAIDSSSGNSLLGRSSSAGELCHTGALMKRMEKIAAVHGLVGVESGCANMLNKAVDAYVQDLIRSCAGLVRARLNHPKPSSFKQQAQVNPINGVLPRNHPYVQNGPASSECTQRLNAFTSMSLEDFRVAMELNPQQLGEDWPVLAEKIYFRSNEE
ncbi:uncharacterized protein LOC122021545 [Zingiber officinale]|uniref:Transcriptional coactivator Hfi1/Transcriptional adapter 1 n=1 Tax=Zingiber officinale TaxID=94328 RepID=A0A8J5F4D6_ZINOF|nr:uncharacterized protein LOC122021545 [Zingiber officinale]KAG6478284.1 hypothetical protein ZIOFF_061719 [Zingiber officinale]